MTNYAGKTRNYSPSKTASPGTNIPTDTIKHYPTQHSHSPPDEAVMVQLFRQKVLEKVSKNPNNPLKKSYDEVLEDIHESVDSIPSYTTIRSSLARKRRQILPFHSKNKEKVNRGGFCDLSKTGKQFATLTNFLTV